MRTIGFVDVGSLLDVYIAQAMQNIGQVRRAAAAAAAAAPLPVTAARFAWVRLQQPAVPSRLGAAVLALRLT